MNGPARLLVAAGILHLVLVLPAAPMPLSQALLRLAPELPLILLALALARLRLPVALALLVLTVQKLADLATMLALGRGFNPLTDLPLVDAGLRWVGGTLGPFGLGLALAAALAALVAGAAAVWWAAGVWARAPRRLAPAIAVLAAVLLAVPGWGGNGPYALSRIALVRQTAQDLRQLRLLAAQDPLATASGLLAGIDRDVLVVFVESYGRASLDVPFYAGRHRATLREAQDRLAQAGLAMRSGFLAAPTRGGQSWLSHATFANGLWIADQARYDAALALGRQGLFHHARRAGFRTAAVMPAITRPWPEGAAMGFDRILARDDLGYRGLSFGWVTMPDQFTLAATDRLLRGAAGGPHLFAQVVLISSHAPWVPVPRLLPWAELDDGAAFDAMARAGDPPEEVWRDPDRVRKAYREALDYSLRTVADYALSHARDPPLMIVLGDHQAAPWVAMDERPDVPIHLIGPAPLVERAAAWGFAPGLVPPAGQPVLPMDRMRDLILGGFEPDAAPGGCGSGCLAVK